MSHEKSIAPSMHSHPTQQISGKDRCKNLDNFGLKSFSVFDSIISAGVGSLLMILICLFISMVLS
jgi:hypothetical protein